MIQMVADHPAVRLRDLSSLGQILYGGSPISEAVLDRASAALPRVAFIQVYGQSELSPVATILHAREHLGEGRSRGRHRSGGRANAWCRSPDRR
jgi:long-chain acyl-CoA synthetase